MQKKPQLAAVAKPIDRPVNESPRYGWTRILWHHGTCDLCAADYTLVLHLGYSPRTTDAPSYRLCKNCLYKHIQYILYGGHDYVDGLIYYKGGQDGKIRKI
jgi:hypothetical protein